MPADGFAESYDRSADAAARMRDRRGLAAGERAPAASVEGRLVRDETPEPALTELAVRAQAGDPQGDHREDLKHRTAPRGGEA